MTTTAIPSSDPADFLINVENLDKFSNSTSNTFTDRMGVIKKTLFGAMASITNSGLTGFATLALLDADLNHESGALAMVTNDPDPANNTTYRKTGDSGAGLWVASGDSLISLLGALLESMARPSDGGDAVLFTDAYNFVLAALAADGQLSLPTLRIKPELDGHDVASTIDERGFFLRRSTADASFEHDMQMRAAECPGIEIVDPHGFLLARFDATTIAGDAENLGAAPAPLPTPYFSRTLCGVAGVDLSVYLAGLLDVRINEPAMRLSITSDSSAYSVSTTDSATLNTARLGPTAKLWVRDFSAASDLRSLLPLSVFTAPLAPPFAHQNKKILMIGDSITHNQGTSLAKEYLDEYGYAPEFIGTMRCASTIYRPSGDLGEGRSGWESGDYTNAITDRSFVVPPGGEAAYLALSNNDKRDWNPFIRAATGADPAEHVRNGYIVDFAFYQNRFGLAAPHIVYYSTGTNDIRDRNAGVLYDTIYANDMLIYDRMRAAWPGVIIIRGLPGTGRDVERDALWTPAYVPVIKAMNAAITAFGGSHLHLAPTWAMVTPESGYTYTVLSTDVATGVQSIRIDDDIHPMQGTRQQLYRAVAGYLACAAAELI